MAQTKAWSQRCQPGRELHCEVFLKGDDALGPSQWSHYFEVIAHTLTTLVPLLTFASARDSGVRRTLGSTFALSLADPFSVFALFCGFYSAENFKTNLQTS